MKTKQKITRPEFVAEVIAEIENIKAKADKSELNRLNFEKFNYCSPYACIYGQMTGDCKSNRAIELTPKKYQHTGSITNKHTIPFSRQSFTQHDTFNYFTALEKYLYMVKDQTHIHIIAYLKGETDTLNLI